MMYYESYSEPYTAKQLPKKMTKWKCIWCGENVLKDEIHTHYAGYWEDQKQNWRMHNDCYNAFSKISRDTDGVIYQHMHKRGSTEYNEAGKAEFE